jgi:hypothetical protein
MRRLARVAVVPLLMAVAAAAAEQEARPPVAAALASLTPGRQPSALLLGLRDGQSYRTLYLLHGGGRITLAADLPLILSPQPDGFWRFGAGTAWPEDCRRQVCDPDHADCAEDVCRLSITQVWQSPQLSGPATMPGRATLAETQRDIADREAEESAYYMLDERITYVARGAICRSVEGHGYTGGAHDFFDLDTHCFALGADLRWGEPLDYPLAAPAEPLRQALEALVTAAREGRFEEVEGGTADPEVVATIRDAVNAGKVQFRLARVDGQTLLTLTASSSASFVASPTYRLTVAAPLGPADPSLAPYNPAPDAFAALRKVEPDLADLFVSPLQGVAFALDATGLAAIDVKSGAELWSMPLTYDRVVMVEWATGADIDRWAEAVAAATAP